jgi:hypothetical protein
MGEEAAKPRDLDSFIGTISPAERGCDAREAGQCDGDLGGQGECGLRIDDVSSFGSSRVFSLAEANRFI